MHPHSESERSFTHRVLIVIGLVGLIGLLCVAVYFTIDVLLLIFSAALIAVFLRGLATPVGRFLGIGDVWSVLLVTALLLLIIAGSIALLAPSVNEQITLLRAELPKTAQAARDFISNYSWGETLVSQVPTEAQLKERIANVDVGSLMTRVGGFFSSTVGVVGNFLIVLLLAIYFAGEPRLYSDGLAKLFPKKSRRRAEEVFSAIGETLSWWLIGKVGSMVVIGLLTWIGLSILGVPMALTLGLLAGLLSFIPNFGPILSAVPAILFAFIESPISAVYVLILYIGVQVIEGNVVTPYIERRTVELPPALTIVAQLGLAVTIGGLGLVLATPLLAVIVVVVQMVYIEDMLGDTTETARIEPIAASDA